MKRTIILLIAVLSAIMTVEAKDTLFVKPDAASGAWAGRNAYTNLQTAIDAAAAGDQIWVAAGTYRPTSMIPNGNEARCKSFLLRDSITLIGGFAGSESSIQERESDAFPWEFAHPTILSGDINNTPADNSDNAYHVVYCGIGTSSIPYVKNAILDGVTITGGNGNRTAMEYDQKGGGIYMGLGCELRNCIISENIAQLNGGGAYIPYTSTLTNCLFTHNQTTATNSGGGAVYIDNCQYLLTVASGCHFIENSCAATATVNTTKRYGGGAVSSGNNVAFERCTFRGNTCTNPGGAAYVGNSNNFTNSFFYGNGATAGGAIFGNSAASLLTSNSLFSNNEASSNGGCISISGSSCRSVNCTFVNNAAPTNTVINAGAGFTLFNSILWNNGDDADNLLSSNIVCKNTAVEGTLVSGTDNLNVSTSAIAFTEPCSTTGRPSSDEEWVAVLAADYTLYGSSVCKDAGSTATISLSGYQFPEFDLNRNPRINGEMIDLGCYEIQCPEEELACLIEATDTTYSEDLPGTGTVTLLFNISNYNPQYTYYLTIGDEMEALEMENGVLITTLEFPGTLPYSIVRFDEESGCSVSLSDEIDTYTDSLFNPGSGIRDLEDAHIFVYPNPASDYVIIRHHSAEIGAEWILFDINGKVVRRESANNEATIFSLKGLEAGIYILKESGDSSPSITKIIKQ